MQSSEEQTDSKQRVTRSMRTRLNSNDSEMNDLENRPDTPMRRLHSAKKTDLIEETVLTPTKRATRGNSAIRNVLEEQIVASPLRRVTRRMSSEVMSSPLPAAKQSQQNLNDSDGECVFVSEQPATPRTIVTARSNKGKVKLEEVVEEEPDVNDKLNNSINSNDSNNDLELRNRVIAKSPVVLLTRLTESPRGRLSTETKQADEKISPVVSQSPPKTQPNTTKEADEKISEASTQSPQKIQLEKSNEEKQVEIDEEDQNLEEEHLDASIVVDKNTSNQNTSEIASGKTLGESEINMDMSSSQIMSPSIQSIINKYIQHKSPKRVSWNNSVSGHSDRIDKVSIPGSPSDKPISVLSRSLEMLNYRSNKVQSDSDESDNEAEEKTSQTSLLIIDEAEVANSDEDSMTPSEKEDLQLNEGIDDGVSLGSQDSHGNKTESDHSDLENDSFIDNEEIDDQYSLNSEDELVEKLKESPKRRSRIIEPSSSSSDGIKEPEITTPKRKSKKLNYSSESDAEVDKSSSLKENESPEKNYSNENSPKFSSSDNDDLQETSPVKDSPKVSPLEKSSSKTKNTPTAENVAKPSPFQVSPFLCLPSKRPSQTTLSDNPFNIPGNWGERLKSSSNASSIDETTVERKRKRESVVHGEVPKRFKEMSPNESEAHHMEIFEDLLENEKTDAPVDIPKLINHCDEYLDKHNQELKAKIAMKRQKKKEKLLKKDEATNAASGSAENGTVAPKKKKNKNKIKKQKLLSDNETEKIDMASKLNKQIELLQQKRDRKKLKKELKAAAAAATGENKVVSMDVGEAPVKTKKKKERVAKLSAEPVVQERKNKKRRIEEVINDEDVEKPKAKKKLKILQEAEQQKYSSNVLQTSSEENIISTVSAKLKKVIPKGLDNHSNKTLKKKARGKVVPEPKDSLPRPVWTSAGVFIEENIEPYPFKSTAYKPRNDEGSATEFRVIPFDSKSKAKKAAAAASKNTKMDLIMQRNKKGRDGSKKNMKNLI